MSPWQVLRAGRATQAAVGHHVHHGAGALVHYSTAAAAAPGSGRSFCLSREKATMQQLNSRLASYLQQVKCLEAANQKLESLIQQELDRKCPRELRELDAHLRTVSLLQDQISECLSAQAQVKLQLLSAELTIFDFNVRYEKEHEHRGCLEEELSSLKLLEEELQVTRLPDLQNLLNSQTKELMELQTQHQQDMQDLLAQMSGRVNVEMQPAKSVDLIQQLDDLRQTNVTLLDKNQNECWFNTQVSMLSSPEVTFGLPAGSEVIQAELEELRRTAAILEEELAQLQTLNVELEASGLEQYKSFSQKLVVLQERADSLCADLDSVLQAAAQQAADHQSLLDVKTRLETEIQDYRRLLDGLSPQGVSSLHQNSTTNVTSFCVTTSPTYFRRNIAVNKTVSVQVGSLKKMEGQAVSRGHIRTVGQTPLVTPLSETVTTVQSIRVHGKHPKNSPVTSINTSNLTGSFLKSENQRTEAFPERTARESMTNSQSSLVEDKVHAQDRELQNSSIISTQISLDKGAVVKDCKPETNTVQQITTLVPHAQPARSATVQAKPETFTSKQTTTEVLQANKTGTNFQTEITKTIVCAEPEVMQVPHSVTHMTIADPGKETAAEVQKQTETVVYAQINCTEDSIQSKNQAQDCEQVVPLCLETPAEAIGDAGEDPVRALCISETQILRSEDAQGMASDDLTLTDDKDTERQDKEEVAGVEGTLPVLMLHHSLALSHTYNSKQNKVMEDANTGSSTGSASSNTPDSNNSLKSKTVQGIISLVPAPQPAQVQLGPHCIPNTITTEPSTHTSAEVKTNTVISDQITCTEGTSQAKNRDCAQVVPSSLETQVEAVGDAAEVAVTVSCVSEPDILRSDEVPGDFTLINDKDIERQEKKGEEEVEGTLPVLGFDQNLALSDESNRAQNEVIQDSDTGSGITTASSDIPEINGNLCMSKTTSTDNLNTVELEVDEGKVVNSFHYTNEVKMDTTELDNEMVNLSGQQTESKKSTCLTDSGVAVSSSNTEELLSPREVSVSPTKPVECLSPEMSLSPVETEVLMSMTEQAFRPVDLEEHVRSPDSLLSPNDSNTCLSPVEANESLSPNDEEEDEEACLSLTEANGHVRPVEKYILSTKEEVQSLSFGRDQALPEENRNRNRGSSSTLNGTNNSKPTSREIGSLWGKEVGGPGHRTMIADKDKQLSFGSQYNDTCGTADNKEVQNPGGSPPGRYGSENQRETSSMEGEVKGQKNGDCLVANMPSSSKKVINKFVKSSSFGSVPANERISGGVASNSRGMATSNSGKASDLASRCTAANSSGAASGNAEASATTGVMGRFRHDSGEWMVYGGSLGHSMSVPNTQSLSEASLPATSQETGRFGSRGSGEWMVYGGSLGRKSSLDGSTSLTSKGKEESPLLATTSAQNPQEKGRFGSSGSGEWIVYSGSLGHKSSLPRTKSEESPSAAMLLATSPPETTRFGSRGSGEWRVYGGSTGRMSGWTGSNSLSDADREEIPSVTPKLPTSPPGSLGTGRFGSGGSGEWRVYGGSTGRMSSWAGSNSLPDADREEIPSVTPKLPTSPPGSLGTGRFGSGGSGEWRVYGGSTGHLSRASSADKVSVSANHNRVISPPSSYTGSGRRLSSAGSGGRLSSGSVVRRSSSVGSGGRLSSSSGTHRTSTSGRFSSTGSGEWKPVYSSANAHRSSVGSTGRSGHQRAPSPGGRMSVSMGSSGWLSGSTASGNCISSTGSGSKLSSTSSSDRISSQTGGRISSSSGSGRTNSTGGRVISSNDRPIRSTGSGAGGNKERISVCKMAVLTISAAGRERSQDRQRQKQQQAAATSPLLQRWLNAGVGVKSANSGGLDDIMRL